jgi:hypothetical protein
VRFREINAEVVNPDLMLDETSTADFNLTREGPNGQVTHSTPHISEAVQSLSSAMGDSVSPRDQEHLPREG